MKEIDGEATLYGELTKSIFREIVSKLPSDDIKSIIDRLEFIERLNSKKRNEQLNALKIGESIKLSEFSNYNVVDRYLTFTETWITFLVDGFVYEVDFIKRTITKKEEDNANSHK